MQAEELLKRGKYVQAFSQMRPLREARLSEDDANALTEDLLEIATMAAEDEVPNSKLELYGEWDAGMRIARMAADPAGNPTSAFLLRKAELTEAMFTYGSRRKDLMQKCDLSKLSGQQLQYCKSLMEESGAKVSLDKEPPDVAAARAHYKNAVSYAEQSGNTGRLLQAWLDFAEFNFKASGTRHGKDSILSAYAVVRKGVASQDLETAGALVRVARIAGQNGSDVYDLDVCKQALNDAQRIYATRIGSEHAMCAFDSAQAMCQYAQGNFEQARSWFEKAAAYSTPPWNDRFDAQVGIALCDASEGKLQQAILRLEVVERAVAGIDKGDRSRRLLVQCSPILLANCYARLGRRAEAQALYSKYLPRHRLNQMPAQVARDALLQREK